MNQPTGWSWTGRVDEEDGIGGRRWHQVMLPWEAGSTPGVVFLGFASDEGIRRNKGRVGAAAGPNALRGALSNLPVHTKTRLYDAGDVACVGNDLEGAQRSYSDRVAAIIRDGHVAIGLGGGHEIAWAGFGGILGASAVTPGGRLGVLNLDAHFDLRKAETPTSGTSFRQILEFARELDFQVDYRVLGISESSNTHALIEAADEFGARWHRDDEMTLSHLSERIGGLEAWFASLDSLYLTICLDVLPGSVAPGVSAPAARGVGLEVLEPIVAAAVQSGKLKLADVAELSPPHDREGQTARTAARLIWRIVRELAP